MRRLVAKSAGVATDYCVKATVLGVAKLGFKVFVIEDAVRGIDAVPGGVESARREMEGAGAIFVRTDEVLRRRPQLAHAA